MSSKADDFDVRYREAGAARHGRADGGYRGNGAGSVDYDLGYDAQGFDTDGFRSPEADLLDGRETDYVGAARGVGAAARSGRASRGGSHARPAASQDTSHLSDTGQLGWESEATGALWAPGAPGRGTGPNRPGGPSGPRRAQRPRGLRGPGRRGLTQVKGKGSWWRHWTLRKALGVLLGTAGAFIVLAAIAVVVAYEQTPVPTSAMAATAYSQSVVYSSNGTLIGRFGTTNRQMLAYNQIPKVVREAVLAAEDRNFFNEGGVSPTGIIRAAYEDSTGGDGSLQGGSTITQEFVRQYYSGIGTQQTFGRKIKEIFVAMKVAKEKSKQWILENYLNTIYLGDGAYGIGAAAETYYGKPVARLDVAQAAVIAAIIQQPSTYPLKQYRAQLENRWHYVLNGMVQMGDLTQQQATAMKFPAPGDYIPQTVGSDPWDPYVLQMVYNELTDVYHLSQPQIYNGGYTIRTTIDVSKMKALYAAVQQNELEMVQGGVPLPDYAQVGAVLENPADGAIEALYPGPGYTGTKYVNHEGHTHTMTSHECSILDCNVNMAVYNREQVGSSFKPYVLSAAVSQGMNVRTSTLDGYDPLYIPPYTVPNSTYSTSTPSAGAAASGWYKVTNDSARENGPYTPQIAMAASINTAYADLWHHVGPAAVANMAHLFGVNTDAACITASCAGTGKMLDEAGVALGQASLTVTEQATMLATIDDNGVYHDAHVISAITRPNAMPVPLKITTYQVFNPDPTLNREEATQVQYAMSEDTASYGTAPTAALSNGQEIIAKTGTTTHYQSAFFIGAIPTQALAVGIFTDYSKESLPSDLGGNGQGGYGGTWPASIWHTYAENKFVPLGIEPFSAPVFTGTPWNEVPPALRQVPKKKPHKKGHGGLNGFPVGIPGQGGGNPNPYPTYTCDPSVVTCATGGGQGGGPGGGPGGPNSPQSAGATAGAAVGGVFAGLPAACLWARRRRRKRAPRRG